MMAGLETIVRPSILPNIRPSPAQRVAGFDDPGQGFAVIHGNPAKQVNLTTTTSISISRSLGQEVQRRVDKVRVYQMDDSGNVNKSNFVDVEVTNRMRLKDDSGQFQRNYRRVQEGENIELLKKDIIYNTSTGGGL